MAQGNKNPKTEHLKEHQFKTEGKHKNLASKPVSIKLPPHLDAFVRSLENRNQWLIDAVSEKVERENNDAGIP